MSLLNSSSCVDHSLFPNDDSRMHDVAQSLHPLHAENHAASTVAEEDEAFLHGRQETTMSAKSRLKGLAAFSCVVCLQLTLPPSLVPRFRQELKRQCGCDVEETERRVKTLDDLKRQRKGGAASAASQLRGGGRGGGAVPTLGATNPFFAPIPKPPARKHWKLLKQVSNKREK
jgi:hypothetical protein